MRGLAGRLAPNVRSVQGSDLDRARDAGYDDSGSLEETLDSLHAIGVSADPVTREALGETSCRRGEAGFSVGRR
jgi:hypothetical protein